MPSLRKILRSTMCLVKRKPTLKISSSSREASARTWPGTRSSKVNQHDSSSSDFSGVSAGYTPNKLSRESQLSRDSQQSHSRESQVSRDSLATVKDVVGGGAYIFHYRELRRATENFSSSRRIGGSVYRGTVRNSLEVAITKHKKCEMFTDLASEVKTLCSVHHMNVVPMIGACAPDGDENVYAVYELIEGVKLRECLRSPHSPGYCVLSTWKLRLQVALDVARGLEYLHEDTHKPFVHKYIKSNNILLDGNTLRARICNFGVAYLAGEFATRELEESTDVSANLASSSSEITEEGGLPSPSVVRPRLTHSRSRKINGTRCYMAPESKSNAAVTTKSDVFSFGVVLLEILSGQEPSTQRGDPGSNVIKVSSLHDSVLAIFNDREPRVKLRQWMDPLLKDSYPLDYALKVALLAKSCIDDNPTHRPEIRAVSLELSKIMTASELWERSFISSKINMSRTMEAR